MRTCAPCWNERNSFGRVTGREVDKGLTNKMLPLWIPTNGDLYPIATRLICIASSEDGIWSHVRMLARRFNDLANCNRPEPGSYL